MKALLRQLDAKLSNGVIVDSTLAAAVRAAHETRSPKTKFRVVSRPPVDSKRLSELDAAIKKATGRPLPDDYRTFLRAHDGLYVEPVTRSSPEPDASFDDGILSSFDLELVKTRARDGSFPVVLPFSRSESGSGFALAFRRGGGVEVERFAPELGLTGDLLVASFSEWLESYIACGFSHDALEKVLEARGKPVPATTWDEVITGMRKDPPPLCRSLWEFVNTGGTLPLEDEEIRFLRKGNEILPTLFAAAPKEAAKELDVFAEVVGTDPSYIALWHRKQRREPAVVLLGSLHGILGQTFADFVRLLSTGPSPLLGLDPGSEIDLAGRKSKRARALMKWAEGKGVTFGKSDAETLLPTQEENEEFGDRCDYWTDYATESSWDAFKKQRITERSAVDKQRAKQERFRMEAPSTIDLDIWLTYFADGDPDAKDAIKAWGELFPHRGARMDRTDEEKTQRAEREHLVDYLLRAFAVPATSDAASTALQAIGYVAHLPSNS